MLTSFKIVIPFVCLLPVRFLLSSISFFVVVVVVVVFIFLYHVNG